MNNLTLDSDALHILTSMGSELIGKSNDLSLALTQDAPVNKADSQISTDIFEQARRAFFSK